MKAFVKNYIFAPGQTGSSEYEMVEVKVGDWVGFKSDTEQHGKIVEIKGAWNDMNMGGWNKSAVLVLENENGFPGDYLRYATRTEMPASDCWIN